MNKLSIKIIDNDAELHDLQNAWGHLDEQCKDTSIFSSYTYVSTAWKYSKNESDKLFILLLSDREKVVGIAPLRITEKRYLGINARVIRYIAEFEGDKPELLALDEKAVWERIADFLSYEFEQWDVITLMEQTDPSNIFRDCFRKPGYIYEEMIDSRSYSVSLNESWDNFYSSLSRNVKKNWRRRYNKLNKEHTDINIEYVNDSNAIDSALDRFIQLEHSGWKKDAHIGVGKDETHRQFYLELLKGLSSKQNVSLAFLKVGDTDIAGDIIYSYKGKLYDRQTAYNPHYAEYSPGIILLSEIIKHYMERKYDEMDLQGLEPGNPKKLHSMEWSTSAVETKRQTIYRKYSRVFPFVGLKQIKHALT